MRGEDDHYHPHIPYLLIISLASATYADLASSLDVPVNNKHEGRVSSADSALNHSSNGISLSRAKEQAVFGPDTVIIGNNIIFCGMMHAAVFTGRKFLSFVTLS